MVNAVVFGDGLLTVPVTPAFARHAFLWIPMVGATSFAVSVPVAWSIAAAMMLRFARVHQRG